MDITIKNKYKNEISISKNLVEDLINILDKVDCTCVWSEKDQQYIKVNDYERDYNDIL